MRLKNLSFLTIIFMLLLIIASACSASKSTSETSQEKSSSNGEKQIVMGFSFGQSVHPFFIAMEKGARAAAEKNDIKLSVASADYKVENQVNNINDLMQKKIDALLVNPVDSKALAGIAEEVNKQDVPLLTVDIGITGAETTSHIASDNEEIGRIAAKYLIEQLDGEGEIAIIGLETVTSTLDREKGFREVIEAESNIQIVASQSSAMERADALDAAENILQGNKNIDAIFAVNESGAMGALSATQSQSLENVIIVGVDATPDLLDAIKGETAIKATIGQDPYKMGEVAVELALKAINGEEVEALNPVETDVITIDNVDEFIAREAEYEK